MGFWISPLTRNGGIDIAVRDGQIAAINDEARPILARYGLPTPDGWSYYKIIDPTKSGGSLDGFVIETRKIIWLGKNPCDEVIVHETLHALHPDWAEQAVRIRAIKLTRMEERYCHRNKHGRKERR